MPVCEFCGEDDPHACSWCDHMTCWECVETTSMGCVHRTRIRAVSNPDWIIIEEAGELTREQYDALINRIHRKFG